MHEAPTNQTTQNVSIWTSQKMCFCSASSPNLTRGTLSVPWTSFHPLFPTVRLPGTVYLWNSPHVSKFYLLFPELLWTLFLCRKLCLLEMWLTAVDCREKPIRWVHESKSLLTSAHGSMCVSSPACSQTPFVSVWWCRKESSSGRNVNRMFCIGTL